MNTQGWRPADTFGTRLVLVRRQQQLSVEVAAATAGVKQASWSSWERGARPRNLVEVVTRVASAFGVDRDWLMWGGPLAGSMPQQENAGRRATDYHPTTDEWSGDSRLDDPALVAA